jgi:hypothetical protein
MVEDLEVACESWTDVIEVFVSGSVVQLFTKKVAYEPWKVGESEFFSKCGDITSMPSF